MDLERPISQMSREQLQAQVSRSHKDEHNAKEIQKWYRRFEKYLRQGTFGLARKAIKEEMIRKLLGKQRANSLDKLYDQFYTKYCQKGEQKWKFWLTVAIIGLISGTIIYYTGLGSLILTFLRNQATHIVLRIGAAISAIAAWVGGVCLGLGNLVYHGLNYLIL